MLLVVRFNTPITVVSNLDTPYSWFLRPVFPILLIAEELLFPVPIYYDPPSLLQQYLEIAQLVFELQYFYRGQSSRILLGSCDCACNNQPVPVRAIE